MSRLQPGGDELTAEQQDYHLAWFMTVRGGTLVAYRWNGEPEIHWENYVPHDARIVAPTPSDRTV